MKTDSLFYRLFQTDPTLVLALAGLTVPEPGRYRFGSQEIKQTAFRVDGEAALLLRQLERRFGPLSADARHQVAEADAETLLVWGERLLEAKTLAEIWGG